MFWRKQGDIMNDDFKSRIGASGLSNGEILKQVLMGLSKLMKEEDFVDVCGKLEAHFKDKQKDELK
jgi:hypothetical protein